VVKKIKIVYFHFVARASRLCLKKSALFPKKSALFRKKQAGRLFHKCVFIIVFQETSFISQETGGTPVPQVCIHHCFSTNRLYSARNRGDACSTSVYSSLAIPDYSFE
jgi:hypothetical protein